MHTEQEFTKLALDFRKCYPVLAALGDENRLHILYQMMCSMQPQGTRVGEICILDISQKVCDTYN